MIIHVNYFDADQVLRIALHKRRGMKKAALKQHDRNRCRLCVCVYNIYVRGSRLSSCRNVIIIDLVI